jgi:predicted PurR-regulated permease PerM
MLYIAAALVIVIAGLSQADTLVLPVLMAALLSLVCVPPMRRLQRWGVAESVSVAVVVVVASLAVAFLLLVVGGSITRFRAQIPVYREQLDQIVATTFEWLDRLGVDVSADKVGEVLDTSAIMQLVGEITSGVVVGLSNTFLVLLTMIFILLEANGFSRKLRLALGDPEADLSGYARGAEQVYGYLFIKAGVSAANGVLASLLTWVLGVDFPLLWGLVAFLFNFVPNIGSIIAAIPAILLALLEHGVWRAMVVAAGYLVINMAIDNTLEPRLMGRRLGLSPLVVFLSLLFWGWLWGPLGMLLSVPLTVVVKLWLEQSDDFRGVAVLLGPAEDPGLPPRRPSSSRSPRADDIDSQRADRVAPPRDAALPARRAKPERESEPTQEPDPD